MQEYTGMRAEFTGSDWFECDKGKNNRRLYSWYGYHGGNMSWSGLMALIVKVHFPDEEDMRFPSEAERKDKTRGVRLTNLEKCLLTKMFYTTGFTFTKLADLWGCCERTVARAVDYWDSRWKRVRAVMHSPLFCLSHPHHHSNPCPGITTVLSPENMGRLFESLSTSRLVRQI